jgi:23S rRNA pseudouridine1911/1915/1917 synthase
MANRGDGQLFHVAETAAGRTLAAFLRGQLAVSWAAAEKLVRSRRVTIHGNLCTDAARRLKSGDVVKLLDLAAEALPDSRDVRIVHLDDAVVIVDKPPGITTTRHHDEAGWPVRRRQIQPTLDELLPAVIGRYQATRAGRHRKANRPAGQAGPSPKARRSPPVRAVHRIDRETSGLLVFARTVPASRILAEQFRQHATQRRYLTVAVGRVGKGTIISHLIRDRGDGRRGSSGEGEGKRAVTHVRPVEHFGDAYTLVECRLETGRTHQIRIQLAESGHPVCGERVYSAPPGSGAVDRSGAPRVALHAAELGFVHPVSGEQLHYSSPLPADLRRLIDRLAAAHGRSAPVADRPAG